MSQPCILQIAASITPQMLSRFGAFSMALVEVSQEEATAIVKAADIVVVAWNSEYKMGWGQFVDVPVKYEPEPRLLKDVNCVLLAYRGKFGFVYYDPDEIRWLVHDKCAKAYHTIKHKPTP